MILTCALFHVAPLDVFRVSLGAQKKKTTDVREVCRSRLDSHRRCVRTATKGNQRRKTLGNSAWVSAANLILLSSSYIQVRDASNLTCTGNPLHNMRTSAPTSLSPHL